MLASVEDGEDILIYACYFVRRVLREVEMIELIAADVVRINLGESI